MYIRVCSYFDFVISKNLERYMILFRVNKGNFRVLQENFRSLESDVQDGYLIT